VVVLSKWSLPAVSWPRPPPSPPSNNGPKALAGALEVIPRTIATNCGAPVVRVLTELRAKHNEGGDGHLYGINGETGLMANMSEVEIWDPVSVKIQTFKTAIESACMLLRIDDIVSGIKKDKAGGQQKQPTNDDEDDTFGDARDG